MDKELKLFESLGFKNEVRIVATKNGKIVHATPWMKNKVPLSADNGRNLILQALSGDYIDILTLTHGEIGTGTTAATDNDTGTETVVARGEVRYAGVSANVLNFKFFFSDSSLANGSYTEITSWINGAAGNGTGHLFNRLVFASTPYVKASGEDTTIQVRVTMTG